MLRNRLNLIEFHQGMREFRSKMRDTDQRFLGRVLANRRAAALLRDQIDEEADVQGAEFGTVQDFIQWLIDNQDKIIAFIMAIMKLFMV
jgi:hypothetical protein